MNLTKCAFPLYSLHHLQLSPISHRNCCVSVLRASLPFDSQKAKFHKELQIAVEAVETACSLCVDVKKSLLSNDGRIVEKGDQTLVTIADFGVQALISLVLSREFPSIPLVAEEDSSNLRENNLVHPLTALVKTLSPVSSLTELDILSAIDRGAKTVNGQKPATYWILDPIDGTKGFVKGANSLYVVGLSLIVEEKIVLGVMGCPSWVQSDSLSSGIIMMAHAGLGTWAKGLHTSSDQWNRCHVDDHSSINEAHICIPESQTWESMGVSEDEVFLSSPCCGSLCKYMMVAMGEASIFIQRAKETVMAWDHAVGVICVEEAGGKVTDWNGKELDFGADLVERRFIFPVGGVLVSNHKLHYKILNLI